jgi:hypothetical protein
MTEGSTLRGDTVAFDSLTPGSIVWRQGARRIVAGSSEVRVSAVTSQTAHVVGDGALTVRHPPSRRALKVVGLGESLGDWSPKKGINLEPKGPTLAASTMTPLGGVYEFKLVTEDEPGTFEWEPGANRYVLHRGEPVDVVWQSR